MLYILLALLIGIVIGGGIGFAVGLSLKTSRGFDEMGKITDALHSIDTRFAQIAQQAAQYRSSQHYAR